MPKNKKTKPELRVVFDTSVLFTQAAHDLVRSEVKRLIEANSKHADLGIQWFLPNVVIEERRYQMQRKALELLPYIGKLERLLGHNLNVTEEILMRSVNNVIQSQLEELGIHTLQMDTATVDWNALIHRSVYRLPPFEAGEKEKGFRDSLIAETFLQLVQDSPVTPSACRLAVVANDELLKSHVEAGTKDAKNVRVLSNMSQLESLINTLVSEVSEEFVAEWKKKASKFFFEEGKEAGLLNRERLVDKIEELYKEELAEFPKRGLRRENGDWWIGETVYVRKERQRTFWITPVAVEAKVFSYKLPETTQPPSLDYRISGSIPSRPASGSALVPSASATDLGWESSGISWAPAVSGHGLGWKPPGMSWQRAASGVGLPRWEVPKELQVSTGKSRFEIHWSVNITQANKLTRPRIDDIFFVATEWEGE